MYGQADRGGIMNTANKVARNLKRKRFWIVFFLFLFGVSLVLLVLLKTDIFSVNKIKVSGNETLTKNEIIQASGIAKGENILRLNIKSANRKIKSLSYIKNASVKRKLPNKIVIDVEEREEKMVIPHIASFIYLDEEGYILSINDDRKETKYPELIGPKVKNFKLGDNIFETNDEVGNFKEFIELSNEIDILKKFDKVDLRDKKNIVIYLKTETVVEVGDFNEIRYKLNFLDNILKDMEERDEIYKTIYLNKGENPIIVTETD